LEELAYGEPVSKRRPYAARVPIEVRREQLLDAAIRVIVRDGYDGVSVEAIAREAGVTRPVVYGVFDGLGPLLGALLDRQQARALEQLATAFAPGATDPVEAMLGAVRTMAERVRSDPLTWQPILAAPQATPDAVRRRIDADRERPPVSTRSSPRTHWWRRWSTSAGSSSRTPTGSIPSGWSRSRPASCG
jgi:AcrR family transcriptional regulator